MLTQIRKQMMSPFASLLHLLQPFCLVLPLGVYLLPRFTTTLEEDVLLAALALYWLLRTANPHRRIIPESWRPLLEGGMWATVYAIAWMGLLRGYAEFGSMLAWLFPVLVLAARWMAQPNGEPPRVVHAAQTFLLGVAWFLALLFILHWRLGNPTLHPSPFQSMAALAIIPLWGVILAAAPRIAASQSARAHLPLLTVLLFASICAWTANLSLARSWWEAGRYERSWTPFRYDDPEQIAEAEMAPFQAYPRYLAVAERLGEKGRLPRAWGWRQTLKIRAVEQGRRTLDTQVLLSAIAASPELRVFLIDSVIDAAFYDRLLNSLPYNRRAEHILWTDIEIDPETGAEYRMDRWGRIFTEENGRFRLVWRPEPLRDGAIDLELFEGSFVILYANGFVVCSRPTDWLERPPAPLYMGGHYVDLEFLHHTRGALVVSSRGEIASLGDAPHPFPLWNEMIFEQDVIVDLEIDWDDRGYYLLDQFGAIHANHVDGAPSLPYRSPPVPPELVPYWSGQSMARDLVIDPLRRGLSIYTRMGETYTVATAPYRETIRPLRERPYRGVSLTAAPDGSLRALEANGAIRRIPIGVTAPQ